MKPVVVVENVSKKYSRNAYAHLSYGIRDLWREILGKKSDLDLRKDEFIAVNDVSFHMNPGDCFAFIGRNGSGKTTLLKMLNGLIKPDGGTIIMNGRVQALINLGAGFNPSLSGKDNIYNAAALMGMDRRQTASLMDEIIDFAELEEFIDSPVQTYSSGMTARLGFAVAIHLKPDILLIDEILSVGDYAFQNKCFVKMHELKKQGVSIILVSHSHTQVVQICEYALWLHKGKPKEIGPAKDVVKSYLGFLDDQEIARVEKLNALRAENAEKIKKKLGEGSGDSLYGPIYNETDKIADLKFALIVDGQAVDSVCVHAELNIRYSFRLKQKVTDLNVSIVIFRKDGLKLNATSTLNGDLLNNVHSGEVRCNLKIPDLNLNPGNYVIVMPVHEGKSYLYRDIVKEFVVTGNDRLTWELVDFRYEYEVESSDGHRASASYLS